MQGVERAFDLAANSSLLVVRNRAGTPLDVIDLYCNASQFLGCFSEPGTLQAAALNQVGAVALLSDTEYTLEVAWKGATDATGFRRVWLDGVLHLESTALDMVAADDCDTGEVRLGIDHYDGAAATGWTAKVRWAQLADDAATPLEDPELFLPARRRGH